eukprot:Skav210019  [mRNA]  locus=scaffold1212:207783:208625:- [translate_table: standard]
MAYRAAICAWICAVGAFGAKTSVPFEEVSSRFMAVLSQVGDRHAEMLVDFHRAAPGLGDMSHEILARSIDLHENYDSPESLAVEVSWFFGLTLWHSAPGDGWRVFMPPFSPFGWLPAQQKQELEKAIQHQIVKQRSLFPLRRTIRAASEKHLQSCSKDGMEAMDRLCHLKSQVARMEEAKHFAHHLTNTCFRNFFTELEAQGLDILKVLADPWKPLSLRKAASFHYGVTQLASQGNCPKDSAEFGEFGVGGDWSAESTTAFVLLFAAHLHHQKVNLGKPV